MKVDGSLKSLLQGVSQQPPRDRLPGQATAQENMLSDPVSGLTRRPPTDLIGVLGEATVVRGWHTFAARDGTKFLSWFHDDTVQVFDLNADDYSVTIDPAAVSYLSSGTMRASTDEEDITIVVNQSVTPSMVPDVPNYFNTGAIQASLVQVLGGQYGRTYTISMDGSVVGTFTTPDGSVAAHSVEIDTQWIAQELLASLVANLDPAFQLARREDIILIYRTGGPFKVTASDGAGNINIKAMNDSVPEVGDLPRLAPHLYVARVAEKTDPEKDLWFKFVYDGGADVLVPDPGAFGLAGYWQECVAPDVPFAIDLTTMPHNLKYEAGAFTFGPAAWEPRKVGTAVSNPSPSFIGNPIKDVASFQGRGVLIAGSNVCMSRTNRPLDHWFGSAAALADTDPIDVNSTVESSNMISAVQHNRDLVVFANEAQFVVFGRTKATPENASLVLTTQFESEIGAHPVGAGKNVFFAANYGRYTAIREFFAEGNTDINDSRPVTQHIKRYIEGKATHLSASSNYDTTLVHTDSGQERVYIYQYIWADSEKVQAALHVWIMKHPVVYSFFDEDRVYFVQKGGNMYYLLRMPLDVQISDGVPYPVYLDQRFDVFGVNKAFLLPYDYLRNDDLVCVQGDGCPRPGLLAQIESIEYDADNTAYRVTLKKSMAGGNIVVGIKFMSRYMPTMPFVKDGDNVVVGTGNLRIRSFLLSLFNSGEIIGRARSKYGDSEPVRFNGRIVGDIENVVGEQPLSADQFLMPFRQDTDEAEVEFYTDSHLPLTILDIEWLGQYSKRGKRIGSGGK